MVNEGQSVLVKRFRSGYFNIGKIYFFPILFIFLSRIFSTITAYFSKWMWRLATDMYICICASVARFASVCFRFAVCLLLYFCLYLMFICILHIQYKPSLFYVYELYIMYRQIRLDLMLIFDRRNKRRVSGNVYCISTHPYNKCKAHNGRHIYENNLCITNGTQGKKTPAKSSK